MRIRKNNTQLANTAGTLFFLASFNRGESQGSNLVKKKNHLQGSILFCRNLMYVCFVSSHNGVELVFYNN